MKTAGAFDNKLMLLEPSSALTATTTGEAVDLNGNDMDELNVRAIFPKADGTNPKCILKYQGSDNQSTWEDIFTFPEIIAAGEYSKKIRGWGRYRRVVATISGTSPDFGLVKVGISTGGVLFP